MTATLPGSCRLSAIAMFVAQKVFPTPPFGESTVKMRFSFLFSFADPPPLPDDARHRAAWSKPRSSASMIASSEADGAMTSRTPARRARSNSPGRGSETRTR